MALCRRRATRGALGLLVVASAVAHAQDTERLIPCRGQRIDSIVVDAQAPTVTGLRRVPLVGDVARGVHVITRAEVIRRYLLMKEGDICTELARAESERILRAQPFLADASVDAVQNSRGRLNLVVRTIDEASLILSASVANSSPNVRSTRVGSANLSGLGIATSFRWRHQPYFDDRIELRVSDYQFAGQRSVLSLTTIREPLGREDRAELTLPFQTDLQRFAWRSVIGETKNHAQFVERDSGRLALGFRREFAEVGGIVRVGAPGRLSLFGLSITDERARPDSAPELLTDVGFRSDTATGFAGRFGETNSSRINALLGVRGIRFARLRGLDALRGRQDVPLGLQIGTLVGRGLPMLGAQTNDVFVAADVYLGFGGAGQVYRLQFQGEASRPIGNKEWEGMVGSGRFSRYSRVSDRRTRTFSVEWSGTSRVMVPHALSLRSDDGGVRGLRDVTDVGGRRGVARLGEQFYIGSPFEFGDIGLAWFVDAGQLWAGDLPYGVTTEVEGSGGLSLLLAVPMRSTRMWRLEFAAPFQPAPGGRRWEVRLSHSDLTTFFWREPRDVNAARARAVPASIYNWP